MTNLRLSGMLDGVIDWGASGIGPNAPFQSISPPAINTTSPIRSGMWTILMLAVLLAAFLFIQKKYSPDQCKPRDDPG